MTSITTLHGAATSARPVEGLAARLARAGSTLLAVWAHPDDESLLGAGLMTAFAHRGGRVVNVTATLGEHGTTDPIADPPSRLADRRRRELSIALRRIGAESPIVLGDEDGTCADVVLESGIGRIGRAIDAVRPDVVLSFGPDGVTGHPDHRAVASWTAGAVEAAGDAIPLVTTQAAAAWPDDVLAAMHRVDAFYDRPERDLPRRGQLVRVLGAPLKRKVAALAAHRSQIGPLHAELGSTGLRRMASFEAYRPANAAAGELLVDEVALAAA